MSKSNFCALDDRIRNRDDSCKLLAANVVLLIAFLWVAVARTKLAFARGAS